jgi:hypothetical protein
MGESNPSANGHGQREGEKRRLHINRRHRLAQRGYRSEFAARHEIGGRGAARVPVAGPKRPHTVLAEFVLRPSARKTRRTQHRPGPHQLSIARKPRSFLVCMLRPGRRWKLQLYRPEQW